VAPVAPASPVVVVDPSGAENLCALVPASLVGGTLGGTYASTVETVSLGRAECVYDSPRAAIVMVEIWQGETAEDFAGIRHTRESEDAPVVDRPGLGGEAYSAGGFLDVRVGGVGVEVYARVSVAAEETLVRQILPRVAG
jgi:hypothetical protein